MFKKEDLMNFKAMFVIASLILTTACSSPYKRSIPEGYTGPTAHILDTIEMDGKSKADFFYISKINGNRVKNAFSETYKYTEGRGMHMYPVQHSREVPTFQNSFKIIGRTGYAAPIQALTGTVYEVKGIVNFTPEKDKTYQVKGSLTETSSSVWIEDTVTKKIMDKKIQINGSAELGFFSK